MTDEQANGSVAHEPSKETGGPNRRRWLLVGAGLLAAVLILVVLPGYLATRPGFFERFPGLSEQYEPWAESTHVEAGCQECHVPPNAPAQAFYRLRMVGEFYASLVTRSHPPAVFGTPTNEACLACHDDLRSVSPSGDLQIPHRAHVSILGMDCVDCHDNVVHVEGPDGSNTPPMSGCLECHDGDTAQDACTACHTEKAAPESHGSEDWLVVHADEAEDPDCNSCHQWTEDWCVDCHSRVPASHADDWRAVHGDAVAEHRGCEACHEGEFCIRCHGEVPQLNLDPSLELVQ